MRRSARLTMGSDVVGLTWLSFLRSIRRKCSHTPGVPLERSGPCERRRERARGAQLVLAVPARNREDGVRAGTLVGGQALVEAALVGGDGDGVDELVAERLPGAGAVAG